MGAGPLGKNIQDQAGAVQHPTLQLSLQVALLAGAEGMVEHDDFRLMQLHLILDLLQFAATHERTRVRGIPCAHQKGNRISSCGQHEFLKFTGVFPFGFTGKIQVNKHSPFARIGTLKKQYYLGRSRETGAKHPEGARRRRF